MGLKAQIYLKDNEDHACKNVCQLMQVNTGRDQAPVLLLNARVKIEGNVKYGIAYEAHQV